MFPGKHFSLGVPAACPLRPRPGSPTCAWLLLALDLLPHWPLGSFPGNRPVLAQAPPQLKAAGSKEIDFKCCQNWFFILTQGYLDFYVRTKNLRRAPFYILSVGNALLMMAVVILNDFCDSSYSCLHTFTKVLPTPWLRTLHILIV